MTQHFQIQIQIQIRSDLCQGQGVHLHGHTGAESGSSRLIRVSLGPGSWPGLIHLIWIIIAASLCHATITLLDHCNCHEVYQDSSPCRLGDRSKTCILRSPHLNRSRLPSKRNMR